MHRSTFRRQCIDGLAELWIRPTDRGLAKLLLSGLSVSDSPVLSDGCCRHRSMHHTLVKAPLLHSPPFRWKSTPWSHHTYTYVLTGTLTRLAHTQTQTHTLSTHIQTRSHYGDKSCLSWLPSVSHGVVCCTSQTPPSSAFHRWVSKGLVWYPWL